MVDFVDLAETSRWLLERYLGGSGNGSDSDDFVNLEMDAAAGAIPSAGDNMLHSFVYSADPSSTTTRPLFSKSAEAELYLLCTNFLLYVAMVIITTIIAKIYFPESLERDASAPIPRKYSYRRQAMQSTDPQHQSSEEETMACIPTTRR